MDTRTSPIGTSQIFQNYASFGYFWDYCPEEVAFWCFGISFRMHKVMYITRINIISSFKNINQLKGKIKTGIFQIRVQQKQHKQIVVNIKYEMQHRII